MEITLTRRMTSFEQEEYTNAILYDKNLSRDQRKEIFANSSWTVSLSDQDIDDCNDYFLQTIENTLKNKELSNLNSSIGEVHGVIELDPLNQNNRSYSKTLSHELGHMLDFFFNKNSAIKWSILYEMEKVDEGHHPWLEEYLIKLRL